MISSQPQYEPIPDDDDASVDQEDSQPEALEVDVRTKRIFFVLGCALLLPWNGMFLPPAPSYLPVLITAIPFFLSRLEDSPSLKLTFSSYLSALCNFVNLVSLTHATFLRKHSPSPSLETRRMILVLAGLTFMLELSTKIRLPAGLFAIFVLLNGAAQASCCSYLQKAVITVGSLYGPAGLQPILSGQAAVAVVVSSVQVLSVATTTWSLPRESIATYVSDGSAEERAAFIFFACSTVFLLFCALAHSWLVRMPLYQRVAGFLEEKSQGKSHHLADHAEEHTGLVAMHGSGRDIGRILKENIIYEFAVAYVFIITLSVFPPITTSILPTSPDIHPLLFSSIHFLVFNTGDLIGRYLCSFPSLLIWSAHRLLALSLSRTLFIPLFLMCNVQRPASLIHSTPVISSDLLYMLILLVFGVTNGYVGTMCIISAPSLEHNPRLRGRKEDVDIVATVINFSLTGGLVIGSAASFGVKAAVCNCNPFTG
ncbi:Nucleoside transporter domain containing protein [Amanita muscaria]